MSNRRMFLLIQTALGLAAASRLGAQEPQSRLSRKQLKELIAVARTAADHQTIAAHFRGEQERHEQDRQEHEEMRKEYERNSSRYPGKYPTMGDHCRSLAGYAGLSAKQAQAMAAMHEKIAQEIEKKTN